MATIASNSCVDQIGETAGVVWKTLAEGGPMSMTKLVEATDQPRNAVMMALGWLAREGKICIEEQHRSRIVSLR